jgi:hypothetical protein
VVCCFIRDRADVSELNLDVKSLLCGQIVKLVIDIMSISNILFETENSESLKHFRLVDHCVQVIGVV